MSSQPEPDQPAVYDPHDDEQGSAVALVIARATRTDGQPPFSDQSLVELHSGARRGLLVSLDGVLSAVAIVTTEGRPREAEFVVSPPARHQGLGARLLEHLLEEAGGELLIWAHGDHTDARTLAARHSLRAQRELLQMRMPLDASSGGGRAIAVAAFRPGVDDAEWLALNAIAFADHPEQGRLDQPDLDARIAEDWFDPEDFLIARNPDGAMTGFCWLKIESADGSQPGEFYAVGVAPGSQGTGLGRALVDVGLARLESRGIREASLYVEADNLPAVSLYRSVGFTTYSIDIQYSSLA